MAGDDALCRRKSAAMPMAAKEQKVASAGSCELEPRAKAKRSVSEVMVMETPALPIARAMRSRTGRSCDSESRALTSTNMSSTPMPIRINGSTLITGLSLKPTRVEKPYANAIDRPTEAHPEMARSTREWWGEHRQKMKTA